MSDLMEHAYPLEAVQLAASVVTTCILFWALYDAAKDSMELRDAGVNGPRSVIAIGNFMRGVFRLLMSFFFVTAGIASVLLPPPPDFEVTPQAKLSIQIVRWVLLSSTALMLVDAFTERWSRQRYVRAAMGRGRAPAAGQDPVDMRKDAGRVENPSRRKSDAAAGLRDGGAGERSQ